MSYLAAMLAGYDTIHLRLKTTTFSRHDTTDIAYGNLITRHLNFNVGCANQVLENLRLRKNIALILTRNPASIKSTYCTGRSSDLFRLSRLPSFSPVAKRATNSVPQSRNGTHSNRHCSGFTPDSLFTFCDARSRKAPCAMTKLEKIFLGCTVKANIF